MDEVFRPELMDSWRHVGLQEREQKTMRIQLVATWVGGIAGAAMASWTIFQDVNGSATVRRVQAPPGQRMIPRQVVGSDARLRRSDLEAIEQGLESAQIPAPATDLAFKDVRGIRWPNDDERRDIVWAQSSDSAQLDDWFTSVTHSLGQLLPAYTDFGFS